MTEPTVEMKPDYAYKCGWQDGLAEGIRRINSLLDTLHSPKPVIEAEIRKIHSLVIDNLDGLRDYQMAQAVIADRAVMGQDDE